MIEWKCHEIFSFQSESVIFGTMKYMAKLNSDFIIDIIEQISIE